MLPGPARSTLSPRAKPCPDAQASCTLSPTTASSCGTGHTTKRTSSSTARGECARTLQRRNGPSSSWAELRQTLGASVGAPTLPWRSFASGPTTWRTPRDAGDGGPGQPLAQDDHPGLNHTLWPHKATPLSVPHALPHTRRGPCHRRLEVPTHALVFVPLLLPRAATKRPTTGFTPTSSGSWTSQRTGSTSIESEFVLFSSSNPLRAAHQVCRLGRSATAGHQGNQ